MPYITKKRRGELSEVTTLLRDDINGNPKSSGDLNYLITSMLDEYLSGNTSYSTINEVIGVLECCKLELYRRIAVPYENKKLEENGEVYDSIR